MSHADSEVVLTDDLAPLLEPWLKRAQRTYDQECGVGLNPIGPVGRLAFESGVPERVIYRIRKGEASYVDIGVADALLMTVDRHISEVDVYRKQEVYRAAQQLGHLTVLIARCRGIYITNERSNRKYVLPALRRKFYESQGARV